MAHITFVPALPTITEKNNPQGTFFIKGKKVNFASSASLATLASEKYSFGSQSECTNFFNTPNPHNFKACFGYERETARKLINSFQLTPLELSAFKERSKKQFPLTLLGLKAELTKIILERKKNAELFLSRLEAEKISASQFYKIYGLNWQNANNIFIGKRLSPNEKASLQAVIDESGAPQNIEELITMLNAVKSN